MTKTSSVTGRLGRRLQWHQALQTTPRYRQHAAHWLPELQQWQAARLRASFEHFLADPKRRDAAEFFLEELYGDSDFTRRDADIARVLPMMQRLLPELILETVTWSIELAALTQALDLRMATVLQRLAPARHRLDAALYAQAYREAGLPRLRSHQIDLIGDVGRGLGIALHSAGVPLLLKLSRVPARLAGFGALQGFLERGFAAYGKVGDIEAFIGEIEAYERRLSQRIFAGEADPFGIAKRLA